MVRILVDAHEVACTRPTFECKPHTISHRGLIGIWCVTVESTDVTVLGSNDRLGLKVVLQQPFNWIIEDMDWIQKHEDDVEKLKMDRRQNLSNNNNTRFRE